MEHGEATSRASELIEKIEAFNDAEQRFIETHPPITSLSVEEADGRRSFDETKSTVTCDVPCIGNNIPDEYNHRGCDWSLEELQHLIKDGWNISASSRSRMCGIKGKFCITPFT